MSENDLSLLRVYVMGFKISAYLECVYIVI